MEEEKEKLVLNFTCPHCGTKGNLLDKQIGDIKSYTKDSIKKEWIEKVECKECKKSYSRTNGYYFIIKN